MSLLDVFEKILPESWFADVRTNYGDILSDELIMDSVQNASAFFNIEDPMLVVEYTKTGVLPNDEVSPNDDILVFSREQLVDLGITGKDSLDLVMTHECAHRMLQGMEHLNLSSHQEELCCDFMAGVRAGLNDIDISQVENAISDIPASSTHPSGDMRVDSIEEGFEFAKEYYANNNEAPTFEVCLDYFFDEFESGGKIPLESDRLAAYSSGETAGGVGFVDGDLDDSTIKGYTQTEINRKMDKAISDKGHYESLVRHHKYMASHAPDAANAEFHLHEAKVNQRRMDECMEEFKTSAE